VWPTWPISSRNGAFPQSEATLLIKLPGGKTIQAWAVEGDLDPETIASNAFSLEWPPRSGKRASFPEIDKAAWLLLPEARRKILKGQRLLLDELERTFKGKSDRAS
jgi:predicted NUDIX family NTP pyrophosphohydrolase